MKHELKSLPPKMQDCLNWTSPDEIENCFEYHNAPHINEDEVYKICAKAYNYIDTVVSPDTRPIDAETGMRDGARWEDPDSCKQDTKMALAWKILLEDERKVMIDVMEWERDNGLYY